MPLSDSRTKALILSHAKDWTIVIILIAAFLAIGFVEPFRREFSLTDPGLFHPYATSERVPVHLLLIICVLVPLVSITFISLGIERSPEDLHNGILGFLLSLTLTTVITEIVKISIGMPRPDFIDRCRPYPGAVDPPFGLSNITVCTQTDSAIIADGFKSFPSGHSSMSFAGLTYLSLFLAGKLHVFDQRGHTYRSLVYFLPIFIATFIAMFIAISRLEDYRHHPLDVTAGCAIGIFFAFFAYRQYYPPLSHPHSHKPLSLRISRTDSDVRHGLTAELDLNNDSSSESDLEAMRIE